MIGIWQAYANTYLYIVGVAMLVSAGIPLLLVPLQWARTLRWDISHADNLTVFMSRTVGAFITLTGIFAFKAAGFPAAKPFYFDLLLWMLAFMVALHVYGALRKAQPITETIEILLWVVLFVLTLCFYPK